jgi:hypothetical protein
MAHLVGWLKELFAGSWVMFSAMALTVALCALVVAVTQRSPAKTSAHSRTEHRTLTPWPDHTCA